MGNEWLQCKLGDITEWSSGGTPPKSNEEYWNGDIPWISASSMDGNRYYDSKLKVTELGLRSGTKLAPVGSILLLVRGSILHQKIRVGIAEKDVTFNQDVKALKVKTDILEPWYLLFWFMSKKSELLGMVENTGIGAGKFDTNILQNLIVDVPPKKKRIEILSFLKALDDRIELNRRMNETLEGMAQALFKSWFVDFDPVLDNAIASGKEIPPELKEKAAARSALGDNRRPLPKEIRTLFPNEFTYNDELGWIPKGWEVAPLGDVTIELRRGISPKYTEEGGVVVVNQRCIRNHEVNFSLARRNDEKKRKVEGRFMEEGDLLINSTGVGTLGRMAQVYNLNEPTVVDSHVTIARANTGRYSPHIFARMMLSIEPYIEAMGEGSTGQTELSRKNLAQVQVIVPQINNQKAVEEYFNNFAEKIFFNSQLINSLTKLRDTLLPKLLSGEIRIPDAEKMVEGIKG